MSDFDPVPDGNVVFRIARDAFVSPGSKLPLRSWLALTTEDKTKATARGREPGLSGFDQTMTSADQAVALLGWAASASFGTTVSVWKQTGARFELEVLAVYLPLMDKQPQPGWEGHVLVEGLRRPPGYERARHNDFLDALCAAVELVS